MAITIGPNNIDSNTTDITFYTNGGTYAQQVNATSGRTGIYPSFTAACTYEGWRYHGQLGGSGGWRETSTWGLNGYWVADQRSPGSYGHDATTGRYYAPVSGYYMFGMNLYVGNDANNSSGYFHMNFLKNGGTGYNGLGRHSHSLFGHDTTNFYVDGVTVENVIYCDQGQYVCPGPYMGGGNGRIYMGHYQFYGHLLP
jgi:hypothetical protein